MHKKHKHNWSNVLGKQTNKITNKHKTKKKQRLSWSLFLNSISENFRKFADDVYSWRSRAVWCVIVRWLWEHSQSVFSLSVNFHLVIRVLALVFFTVYSVSIVSFKTTVLGLAFSTTQCIVHYEVILYTTQICIVKKNCRVQSDVILIPETRLVFGLIRMSSGRTELCNIIGFINLFSRKCVKIQKQNVTCITHFV